MRLIAFRYAVPVVGATAALAGCGGSGNDATGDIRDAVVASVELKDHATCSGGFTDKGIMAYYSESSAQAARKDCADEVGRKQNQDRAKQLKVSEIHVNGTSATAKAQLGNRSALYALVKQGGSWKVDGIREANGSSANSATTSTATTSTPTSTSAVGSTNRLALEIAARDYNAGSRRFISRTRADAAASDLNAVKADASDFRDVVFNFDTAVRKITPSDSARDEYAAVLEASRTTIADLDAIGSVPSPAEFGRLFRSHVAPDTQRLIAAEGALYDAL